MTTTVTTTTPPLYFLCQLSTLKAISYGPLPKTWGNITGLANVSPETVSDLTWAGYPDHAFLSAADATAKGIDPVSMQTAQETYNQYIAPSKITMRQAKLQLDAQGSLAPINAYFAADTNQTEIIEWQTATVIFRSDPLVSTLQTQLGWTNAQVDQFFQAASLL